jgi:5-methylcytosine-specific restriction enzyme subunit McrC
MPRTLTLTERVASLCRLHPADVEFLLAHHAAHLDLAPTGRRHLYRVRPAGRVGVVVAPGCRLVIQPKIPLRNVFFMLDPQAPPPALGDPATPAGTEALDFLAGQLALRLGERAAAGLHRAYAERAEQGPYLLGKLDLPAQLREAPLRKEQLHCRHDDFTADVACNQVPRAVAELLAGSPLVGEEVRVQLRKALAGFEGVRPAPLTPDVWPGLLAHQPPGYGPLLELSRCLAESLVSGAPAFLLDLERVFERHVTRGVVEAFSGGDLAVSVQPAHAVHGLAPGPPEIHLRPDVTVDRSGRPVLVLDAKWKRLRRTALVTPDLYQALAYCAALAVGRAVLVYPGRRRRAWEYEFPQGVRLGVWTLDVAGTREQCARALRRLGRELRRAASGRA